MADQRAEYDPGPEPFDELGRCASLGATKARASADELAAAFRDLADGIARRARRVADLASGSAPRVAPPLDLERLVATLECEGPGALTRRERRVLVSSPSRIGGPQLERLLSAHPELVRHAARTCLTHWIAYTKEEWGEAYRRAIVKHGSAAMLPVFASSGCSPAELLSRHDPRGDVALASTFEAAELEQAHEVLRGELGLRDTWLFVPCVLAAWFRMQVARRSPVEKAFRALVGNDRLRILLLPRAKNLVETQGTLRSHVTLQAQTVATLLSATFASPPLLSKAALSELVTLLLGSSFEDPRGRLLSDGWEEVSRLADADFRKLLALLCEQDLEVFFNHAMNEPDRRAFWLRYLRSIERTGCVLDVDLRNLLQSRLSEQPALSSAIERAFVFSRRSNVQAFFMLFREYAIIEFSDSGNAAYIYDKKYFVERVEPRILRRTVDGVGYLKMASSAVDRISHTAGWEQRARQRLAELGLHQG